MIYTRMGSPVVLVANCGLREMSGFEAPVGLLRFRYKDDPPSIYRYIGAHALRADGGHSEIADTIRQLPAARMSKSELRFAEQNLS